MIIFILSGASVLLVVKSLFSTRLCLVLSLVGWATMHLAPPVIGLYVR